MSKHNSEHAWIEAGYNQFSAEGIEGLQVERLSRITGLNKSGYYHYFGDQETFLEKLMEEHVRFAVNFVNDLGQIEQFDPDYINQLIKYKTQLMFTSQLIRNRQHKLMVETHARINEIIDPVLSRLFADFIGFKDHVEFSVKYFNQVRFMFHSKITPDRMTYPYLRDFLYEAREVVQQIIELAEKKEAL